MPDPVAALTLALLGDPSSFEKMIAQADKKLGSFASRVERYGARIEQGLTKALSGAGAAAAGLEAKLAPVAAGLDTVTASSSAATAELDSVAGAAGRAKAELGQVGAQARQTGQAIAGGMAQTTSSTGKAQQALSGFMAMINRARSAASRPIVQRVSVQQTGGRGGSSRGGNGRAGSAVSGYGLLTAGGAILGAEGELVKQGLEFDDSIHQLYAHAGETAPMDKFKRSVLGVAEAFDQLPQDAGNALYPIESAGHHGAEALVVLSAAAAMARGTTTDLNTTTTLVTKTLTAYGLAAKNSGQVTDVYTNAIRDALVPGKEFVPAMSNVMDIGSKAGLTLQELSAALAMMTRTTKSAATGSTYLKAFMSGLINPTKAMRDAAETAGLGWLAAGRGAEHLQKVGLAATLREINAATKGGSESNVGKLFPDMRKNQALLSLLRNDAKEYAATLKDVQNSGGAVKAANKVQDNNPAQEARRLKAETAALGANLETDLAPALLKIGRFLDMVLQGFNHLDPKVQTGIALFVGAAGAALSLAGAITILGPGLVTLAEVVAGAVGAITLPIAAVIAGVALLAVAWIRDWGHIREVTASFVAWARPYLGQFTSWLTREWHALTANLVGFWASIKPQVMEIVTFIANQIKLRFALIISFFEVWGPEIWGKLRAIWDTVRGVIKFALDSIESNIRLFLDLITGNWRKYWSDLNADTKTLGNDLLGTVQNVWTDIEAGMKGTLDSMQAYWDAFWVNLKQSHSLTDAMNAGNAAAAAAHGGQTLGQAGVGATNAPSTSPNALVEAMIKHVGEATATECGAAVSQAMHESGFVGSATALAKAALHDPSKQVSPDGNGNFPPGTIIYFPDKKHPGEVSGTDQQHFVVAGDIDKNNQQKMAESTTAGGQGRHYRYNRTFKDIAEEHGGQYLAFRADGTHTSSNVMSEAPLRPPKLSTDHSLADAMNNKSKAHKPALGGSLQDISLKHLDTILPADLTQLATGAGNYEDKLQRLNEALAEHALKMQDAGKGYDKYGLKVSELVQRLVLADNALRNTGKKIAELSPKVSRQEKAVTGTRGAFNSYADQLRGKKSKGEAFTPAETAEYQKRRDAYNAALALYNQDDAALKENRRVHAQATQNKISDLDALATAQAEQERKATERFLTQQKLAAKLDTGSGGITRDQYDQSLQDALDGKNKSVGKLNPEGDDYARIQDALTQSQVARQQASGKISKETLALQKKDFDALQQDLNAEVQAYQDAGVAEADVATFRNLKQHEIDMARTEQARRDQVEGGKEMLDLGLETAKQYQQQLGQAIASLQDDWAKAGTDAERQGFALQVAKLRLEISKIDWDAAAKQVDDWKQALDTGKLGIEEYILRLKDLQAGLPQTSEEYKRLTGEINSANKEIYDKAKQTADGIAGQMSGGFMDVIHKAKSMREAVRDTFKTMMDDAIKKQVEDALKKTVMKIVLAGEGDKQKKAAEEHKKSSDKMAFVVNGLNKGADTFKSGVATFASYVDKFTAAVNQKAASPGGGGAASSSGGSASGGVTPGNAASVISDAGSGDFAGAALSALNSSGDGGAVGQIGTSILPDLQKGNDAQAAETGATQAAGMGLLGNTAASIAPWIGVALALGSLLGPHKETPTFTQNQQYAKALSDFSSTVDSGYSGADGLRTLLGPVSGAAAGAGGLPASPTVNIAAGAFQAHGVQDPQAFAQAAIGHVLDEISRQTMFDNARRGGGS